MAQSPRYKVFSAAGSYEGSAKEPTLAAVMADFLGPGSTVRVGHAPKYTVWTAPDGLADSWDVVHESIVSAESSL